MMYVSHILSVVLKNANQLAGIIVDFICHT